MCVLKCVCETECLFAEDLCVLPKHAQCAGRPQQTINLLKNNESTGYITTQLWPSSLISLCSVFKSTYLSIWVNPCMVLARGDDVSRCLTCTAVEPSVRHHPPNYCVEFCPGRTICCSVCVFVCVCREVSGSDLGLGAGAGRSAERRGLSCW